MDALIIWACIGMCMFMYLSTTEGTVTVYNLDGGNTVTINRTLKLVCTVSLLGNEASWSVGGYPLCSCTDTFNGCLESPDLDVRYTCSTGLVRGKFMLTVRNVTIGDEGSYTCEHLTELNAINITVEDAPTNQAITDHVSGVSLKVIVGRQQSLTCTVQGGRPPANLSWSCFGGTEQTMSTGEIISQQVMWTAALAHDGQRCTCQATHPVWSSTREVYVVIDALYPPSTPTFTIQGQYVSGTVKVIEAREVSVRCSSSSNPSPSYTWTPRGSSMSSDTLILTNVQISDQRDYTCTATNRMVPSQGAEEPGTSSAAANINVLYAPMINSLIDDTTIENRSFFKICSYTSGNPPATVVEWTKSDSSTVISRDPTLTISQVSKASAGNYTCTAKNIMVPTGESAEQGIHSQTFQLVVYYSPSITLFSINSQSGAGPLTVNENSTFTVRCDVDSNPGSQITLTRDGVVLRSLENTREATHNITKVTCLDAGMYSCAAQNPYNGNSIPKKTKQVYVRCPPRPFNTEYNQTYYRALNDNVTLNIEFTAYPAPTLYSWYKQQSDHSWTEITVGKSSAAYHANLTIENIKEKDFGQYRVNIANNLGLLEHTFFVAAQVVPERSFQSAPIGAIGGGVGAVVAIIVVVVVVVIVIVKRRRIVQKDAERVPEKAAPRRNDPDSNLTSDHQYYNAAFQSGSEDPEGNAADGGQRYETLQTTESQLYDQLHQTQGDATSDSNRSTYEQLDPCLRQNEGEYDDIKATEGTPAREMVGYMST